MKRFGLIGHPVAGSFSPRLFEAAYGGRYAYDLIEGADFGASWQRFLDDYAGINITAPFKQDAFRAVDILSDDARRCGAVNLAVKTPAGLVGHNTDVAGVLLAVREALGIAGPKASASVIPGLTRNLPPQPAGTPPLREALVIGCGGAGRAAAVAAQRLGCRVTLANRTPARAAALASELGCAWVPIDTLGAPASTTPITPSGDPASTPPITPSGSSASTAPITTVGDPASTPPITSSDSPASIAPITPTDSPASTAPLTPVSDPTHHGTADHPLPPPTGGVSPDLVIYTVPGPMEGLPDFPEAIILEANYKTPVLEGRGKAYISGLRWLLYQAVAGYEIFTGETPDADAMFRIFC